MGNIYYGGKKLKKVGEKHELNKFIDIIFNDNSLPNFNGITVTKMRIYKYAISDSRYILLFDENKESAASFNIMGDIYITYNNNSLSITTSPKKFNDYEYLLKGDDPNLRKDHKHLLLSRGVSECYINTIISIIEDNAGDVIDIKIDFTEKYSHKNLFDAAIIYKCNGLSLDKIKDDINNVCIDTPVGD